MRWVPMVTVAALLALSVGSGATFNTLVVSTDSRSRPPWIAP
jgi:hypothetical protein